MSEYVTLVCWTCGRKSDLLEVDRQPGFAVEVAQIASHVKWLPLFDFDRGRLLIFCSTDCGENARLKDGRYRLRPKRREATA